MAMGVHPLNKEKFYEAINLYISGQASQVKVAKVAGCSVPTFKKYANKIYGSEELPDNLWGKNNDWENCWSLDKTQDKEFNKNTIVYDDI